MRPRWVAAVSVAALILAWPPGDAAAQIRGHYVPGTMGMQAGTQAPPGLSWAAPFYYYSTDALKDDSGSTIDLDLNIDTGYAAPALVWVTSRKLLGANVGGQFTPLVVSKARIEGRSIEEPGSWAFSDLYFQPLQLGWHTERADFVAGYGVFLPTGKYEFLGSDNAGLGMWSHVFQAGTTLRLGAQRTWTASLLASYETHSDKEDTDIRVGDILTIEGGAGKTFYRSVEGSPIPRIANLGIVYYGQLKVTSDEAGVLTPILQGSKDRVFALGIEGNVYLPKPKLFIGLRVLPEFDARNRTEGIAFMLTFSRELKSLVRPP